MRRDDYFVRLKGNFSELFKKNFVLSSAYTYFGYKI